MIFYCISLRRIDVMNAPGQTDSGRKPLPWFTQPQRKWLAMLLMIGFLAIAAWWLGNGGLAGSLVNIDDVAPQPYLLRLDLNHCDWPPLTVLPGISETMARRIVLYRDRHGPFQNVDQLLAVPGIGPKTLRRLRPHLYCGRFANLDADRG